MTIGWPEPPWRAVVRQRSDELARSITEQVAGHRVTAVVVLALDPVVVTASCAGDRAACAHAISAAAGALLWSEGLLDERVGLRVRVDGLTADVAGGWLAGRRWDRASWRQAAALSIGGS